jgi:ribosome modulation factor
MNVEINTNSEAYNTGFAAAEAGEPRTACPYAAGTWDAINWLAGWDAA